jgi:hypothetical protein
MASSPTWQSTIGGACPATSTTAVARAAKGIQPFLDQYEALLDDRDALDRAFDEQTRVVEKLEAEQARVTAELATEQRRHELLAAMLGMREDADDARARAAEAPMVQAIERELRKSGRAGIRLELIDIMRNRRLNGVRHRLPSTVTCAGSVTPHPQTTARPACSSWRVRPLRRGLSEGLLRTAGRRVPRRDRRPPAPAAGAAGTPRPRAGAARTSRRRPRRRGVAKHA